MTAQAHERLIFDGIRTSMAFCPPLPAGHPRIAVLSNKELSQCRGPVSSTACWRRYIGTWEIKEGRFYLVRLEGRYRLIGDEPLLADWFTGVLRIPRGELLQYVHMGFGSVFERELHIKVEQGIVVASRVVDNRGQPHDQWEIGGRNLPGMENRFPGDDEL